MSDEQAAVLIGEARELRHRGHSIRLALAAEKDRRQRFRYYEALRDIGDSLVPIERRLLDAGRAPKTDPTA
ncbi:hypothetical protein [Caenimonas aquaedulcis]|uniref:Uncharacterized protein n=1 Tax=Caenimonas aquaedulcis TaxID=2793270 RepID=A0A931H6U1_9BURK|nr:hypothetical protein [Caenimonas aquaedulcis]MBG9389740.1 hypothetical protein [Caenimonas aquaedulcis]